MHGMSQPQMRGLMQRSEGNFASSIIEWGLNA